MRLAGGFHCFVWGGLAALLYGSPANPDRDVKAAPVRPHAIAASASGFALASADARAALPNLGVRGALPDLDARAALPDLDAKAVPADPDAKLGSREAPDECLASRDCIDQYLWSIYDRARKVDTVKVQEKIKVTVKKKGKTRTITKTVTKFVNEDFGWKDPQAAEKFGMSVKDYVIGGMDRVFKERLYHLFQALDEAGLAPGMTSGFRDDYRQSIASGNKAASDSSYHGGTRRGGYGRGLAADLVSTKGETRAERMISSEIMWKWIDANGQQFGIGRPYLDRDPPHVGPIDGKEYADKRGVTAKRAGL
jgi:hypothetical protein